MSGLRSDGGGASSERPKGPKGHKGPKRSHGAKGLKQAEVFQGGRGPRREERRPARATGGQEPGGAVGRPEMLLTGKVSAARAAAFAVLERVGTTSGHSDDLLHGPLLAGMSQVDRDLATALVLGVLRWQIALDARLRPLLSRPDMRLGEPVAIALRLGAFQLLHMERIPAHAALNESVELVRAAGQDHAAGMVNAVLRKLVGAAAARKPLVESTETMAERLGHPAWMVKRWVEAYGRAAAEAICAFDQKEPGGTELFRAEEGEIAFPVMDAGSRLVAELAAMTAPEARRVWDCCAAPGGKTVVLGRRLAGAEILATDTSPVRARRLGERLERDLPGSAVRVEVGDAAALPASSGEFDLILCDVPCSGTGTLGRNPEIRSRLRVEDIARQAERQGRILRGALERLGPGGRLVYSTCSLEPEECQGVVETVLRAGEGRWRLVGIDEANNRLRESGRLGVGAEESGSWTREGCLRTLPGVGFEGDGFYAAVIERG